MALTRRSGQRFQANIWPGFVDAMTALLLVLMFVLSIFMIVQFMLRETISGQETELNELNAEVAALAQALGLEQMDNARLSDQVSAMGFQLTQMQDENAAQQAMIATLNLQLDDKTQALDAAALQITEFEARVAALVAQNTEVEAARAAAQASADTLRDRLENAEDEITAMTLSLEEQRRQAEETLTLLAAAQAAQKKLDADLTEAMAAKLAAEAQIDRDAALLAVANSALEDEEAKSAEASRKVALLNQQLAALRAQLTSLQGLLDEARARDAASNVQIEALGTQLNAALAQAASEQRRRAELEEAERIRLEEEARRLAEEAEALAEQAQDLENYRSEFFGRLREVLADREGVRVVGDRFVFSSEVLFPVASATLAPEGQAQIANVVNILQEIADEIPAGIDWIIRVDGHTDNVPLSGGGRFQDNWELSQARALSVVRYMTDTLGFPPERLAATGFGEYQPVNADNTEEARAQNRRIELKLTER